MSFTMSLLKEPNPHDAYQISLTLGSYLGEHQRSTELEQIIATDARMSFMYAANVIEERFILGEPAILQNARTSLSYAKDVVRGPWPEGEAIISTDPQCAYEYARYILKGRFKLGEPAILRVHDLNVRYREYISSHILDSKYLEIAEAFQLSVSDVKEIHSLCSKQESKQFNYE